ncbi:MAG: hypothetical protein ABI727_01230, partial [Nitrosospira sp.]
LSQVKSAVQQAKDLAVVLERLACKQSSRIMFMGRIGHGQLPQARSMRLSLEDLLCSTPAGKPP